MAKIGRPRKKAGKSESEHPGVKLIEREGPRYFARWADPRLSHKAPFLDKKTGEPKLDKKGRPRERMKYVWREESLDSLGLKTLAERRKHCEDKSKWLMKQRRNIATGRPVEANGELAQPRTVPAAIEDYFKRNKADLRPATIKSYKQATKVFEQWCALRGKLDPAVLGPRDLGEFRAWFLERKAHVPVTGKGVGRGTNTEGEREKSDSQKNKVLRSLRVVLQNIRAEGQLLPELQTDDIRAQLKSIGARGAKAREAQTTDRRQYLTTKQIRELLKAAKRFDNEWTDQIAPFAAMLLLTGMRFSEAAGLLWSEVADDFTEIRLPGARTKTGFAREVRLAKVPSLRAWLKRAKLEAGSEQRVFPNITRAFARFARKHLVKEYGAPKFTWHQLRKTAGTYAVCSSLYGLDSAHEAARQLGHGILVAQSYYVGRPKDVHENAESMEQALGCLDLFNQIAGIKKSGATAARKTG